MLPKKDTEPADVPRIQHAAVQEKQEAKLVPATIADMSQEERDVLEPLLKTVGDCNIYIENKK